MYQQWYSVALELERQYGPDERVMTLVGHNAGFTFKKFERAQLQGSILIAIEDGTNIPKTPLGRRAAMERANQMGLLGPAGKDWDQEERYKALKQLGVEDLTEALDGQVKVALEMQDAFESWAKEQAPGLQEALAEDARINQQQQAIEAQVEQQNVALAQDFEAAAAAAQAEGRQPPQPPNTPNLSLIHISEPTRPY